MKKLKLKVLETATSRLLTREQLKNIVGGSGNSCAQGCPTGQICLLNYTCGPICPDCPPYYHCDGTGYCVKN